MSDQQPYGQPNPYGQANQFYMQQPVAPPAPGIGYLLFSFDGRIRRLHYWLAVLGVTVVFSIIFTALIIMFVSVAGPGGDTGGGAVALATVGGVIIIAMFVLLMWIGLALQVKRWHDLDKAWTWIFIGFIPIVGFFWILAEVGFTDGTQGPNRYGPSPKGFPGLPMYGQQAGYGQQAAYGQQTGYNSPGGYPPQ